MKLIKHILVISILVPVLTACGGGGGETSVVAPSVSSAPSSSTVAMNNPPVINVPTEILTKENTFTEVDASDSTDSDGEIISYEWRQISGQSISLQNTNTRIVSFNSPDVSQDQVVILELTITDNDSAKTTSQVVITIEDTTLHQPIISLQRSGSNVSVNWDDVNADSYRLIIWQNGTRPLEINTSSTTLNLDNLSTGTYNVIVEAYDSLGHSIFSKPSQIGV